MSYGIPTNTHNIAIFEEWSSGRVKQPLRAWANWREVLFVAGCGFDSARDLAAKCNVGRDLANRVIDWAKSVGIFVDVSYRKFIAWTALFRPARGKVTLRQLEEALADNGLSFPVADRYVGRPSVTKAPSIGHPSYMSSGNSLLNERTSDVALADQQPDSQGTTSSVEQPEQQNTQAQQVGCVKALDREEWAESKAKHGGSAAAQAQSNFMNHGIHRLGSIATIEKILAEVDGIFPEEVDETTLPWVDRRSTRPKPHINKVNWMFDKNFVSTLYVWAKTKNPNCPWWISTLAKKQVDNNTPEQFTTADVNTALRQAMRQGIQAKVGQLDDVRNCWEKYLSFQREEERKIANAKLNNAEFCAPPLAPEPIDCSDVPDAEIDKYVALVEKHKGNKGQAVVEWAQISKCSWRDVVAACLARENSD